MEEKCKSLLEKYVRSDSAIACLELSGYTSDLLISNLDSNQIDQIEDFVRHACTVMNANNSRTYLGNLFSSHPGKFCFPIGVRMGIMLAVNELKQRVTVKDAAVQTDLLVTKSCTALSQFSVNNDRTNVVSKHVHESSNTISRASIDLTKDDVTEMPYEALMSDSTTSDTSYKLTNNQSKEYTISDRETSSSKALSESYKPQLEHLKAHSSASAIRLASRQFINAVLVPGQHFYIDMEIVDSAQGSPRITGIFHCYLCRQKRAHSTSVRFSVSRNRYPVMSNVLSHLKIHFQVQGAHLPPKNDIPMVKREANTGSESSTGLDSLSPFNLEHLLTNNGSLSADIKF